MVLAEYSSLGDATQQGTILWASTCKGRKRDKKHVDKVRFRKQKSSFSRLYEGNVLWKSLFHSFQPLHRLSEGGEVRHHSPKVVPGHEVGEHVAGCSAQQMELDVQVFAFLFVGDIRALVHDSESQSL